LLADAVELMADRRDPERIWAKINRDWSEQVTAVATDKYAHNPIEPVIIAADDLRRHTCH
jgi:hypothetical protein